MTLLNQHPQSNGWIFWWNHLSNKFEWFTINEYSFIRAFINEISSSVPWPLRRWLLMTSQSVITNSVWFIIIFFSFLVSNTFQYNNFNLWGFYSLFFSRAVPKQEFRFRKRSWMLSVMFSLVLMFLFKIKGILNMWNAEISVIVYTLQVICVVYQQLGGVRTLPGNVD